MMDKESHVLKRFLVDFGKNVKKARKKKSLTLEAFGLDCGLTKMQVHRIEKGYNITLETLLKLSLALNVSLCDLLKSDHSFKPADLENLVNNNKSNKIKRKSSKG